MRVVINVSFGGFSLPEEFCKKYNMDKYDDIKRTDERLVKFVISHKNSVEVFCGRLVAKEIPDNATDYIITEYDGAESIYYVLDGKIYEI